MGSTTSEFSVQKRMISQNELPRVLTLRTNNALKMNIKSSVIDQSISDVDLNCNQSIVGNQQQESIDSMDSFIEYSSIIQINEIYNQDFIGIDFSMNESLEDSF
ncbi:hypothetical protein SS50377_26657 [Spironucleus salmonicida]|uniref:Uncharacterized protein n=1 Tax=Spironucleus salmonicida TaxID=348837 RepID=V6LCU5_9EUKA|nr:hypothetical protein SS50377_26657 [Spironucleus salmonicida]|eukprot:EST41501.1 Hypothetical protein SS50377_19230 [Spironucleus salmonicida]